MRTALAFYRLPILLLGILFFFPVSFVMAQNANNDSGDNGTERIAAISVTGLRRTRLSTAERYLRRFIGLEANQVDADEVKAAILATGILEPLSVEIEGNVLAVAVREKWTIFPVPVMAADSGGFSGGLAFFDANAFGLNDKFFLAGFYHADGWIASLGYIYTSRGGLAPGWSGIAAFSRAERHDRDQNNVILRRFEFDTISIFGGLNFPLLKDSDLLSASALFSFNDKKIRNPENSLYGPDEDLRIFGAGGEFAVRKNTWDGYLLSQEAASIRYSYRTSFSGLSFQSVQFRGLWEKSLIPGFRLNLRTGLVFEPDAPVLFESSPNAAQVAILPRDFSARNYAGLSAGLEKHLLSASAGTLTVAAAYQFVHSQGSILGDSFDHGCVGMLSFYLRRLAIPAVGLGVAYNVNRNYLQGSFSLGMSF